MKLCIKVMRVIVVGMLLFGVAACDEQKKKAEERGTIPGKKVDDAQKKVEDAVSKMEGRLQQDEAPEDQTEE